MSPLAHSNRLEELANRTRTIEDTLRATVSNGSLALTRSNNGNNNNNHLGAEPYSGLLPDTVAQASISRTGNPVSAIAETFATQGIVEDDESYYNNYNNSLILHDLGAGHNAANGGPGSGTVGDYSGYPSSPLSPDAVSRGLITVEQAQRYFAL